MIQSQKVYMCACYERGAMKIFNDDRKRKKKKMSLFFSRIYCVCAREIKIDRQKKQSIIVIKKASTFHTQRRFSCLCIETLA